MSIQMRRGALGDLPVLDDGEYGYVNDFGTEQLFIGTAGGVNLKIPMQYELDAKLVLDATGSGPTPIAPIENEAVIYYSAAEDPTSILIPDGSTLPPNHLIVFHKQFSAATGFLSLSPFGADTINGAAAPFVAPSTEKLVRLVLTAPGTWIALV